MVEQYRAEEYEDQQKGEHEGSKPDGDSDDDKRTEWCKLKCENGEQNILCLGEGELHSILC